MKEKTPQETPEVRKGFFARLLEKFDKKLEAKAKEKGCSCKCCN